MKSGVVRNVGSPAAEGLDLPGPTPDAFWVCFIRKLKNPLKKTPHLQQKMMIPELFLLLLYLQLSRSSSSSSSSSSLCFTEADRSMMDYWRSDRWEEEERVKVGHPYVQTHLSAPPSIPRLTRRRRRRKMRWPSRIRVGKMKYDLLFLKRTVCLTVETGRGP